MKTDDIAYGQQFIEGHLARAQQGALPGGDHRVGKNDLRSEARQPCRDAGPDIAHPHQSDGFPPEFLPLEFQIGFSHFRHVARLDLPVFQEVKRSGHLARQHHHQGDGQIRDGIGVSSRRVDDGDAVGGGSREIDVDGVSAAGDDGPQAARLADGREIHNVHFGDENLCAGQRSGQLRASVVELLLFPPFRVRYLPDGFEFANRGFVHRGGDKDVGRKRRIGRLARGRSGFEHGVDQQIPDVGVGIGALIESLPPARVKVPVFFPGRVRLIAGQGGGYLFGPGCRIGKDSRSDARQHSRAYRRHFRGWRDGNGRIRHVCDNPRKQRALGHASGDPQLADFPAGDQGELFEVDADGKGDPLHQGAGDVPAAAGSVACDHVGKGEIAHGEADDPSVEQGGPERGINVHGARDGFFRLRKEAERPVGRIRIEKMGKPVDDVARDQAVALQNIPARHDVQTAPEAAGWIQNQLAGHQLQGHGGPGDDGQVAVFHRARAEQTALGVGPARRHGDAGHKTQQIGRLPGETADGRAGIHGLRKERPVKSQRIDEIESPTALLQIEKKRFPRLGAFGGHLSRQDEGQPVRDGQGRGGLPEQVGRVVFHPQQARAEKQRRRPVPGDGVDFASPLGAQHHAFAQGPGVPVGGCQKNIALPIQRHDGVAHAADGDARDPVRFRPGLEKDFAGGFGNLRKQTIRVDQVAESACAGRGRMRPVSLCRYGFARFRIQKEAAAGASAHIDGHQIVFCHV